MGGSLDGLSCSMFTAALVRYIRRTRRTEAWNTLVQPTTTEVARATGGRQNPVFDERYLGSLLFETVLGPAGPPSRSGESTGCCATATNEPTAFRSG